MLSSRASRFSALFAGLFLAFSMVAVDHADARRGGSFGSRGSRTFQSAPPTQTAPQPGAPVQRSMTPDTATPGAARQQTQTGMQRPGFMNGFGGTMMRGLLLGGLIGLLLGHGLGGLAGMLGMLLQVLLIGGAIFLALRFFRSQSARQPAPVTAGGPGAGPDVRQDRSFGTETGKAGPFTVPRLGLGASGSGRDETIEEISPSQSDLDAFERSLTEVQEAFGREDHAALRRLVTPEMVSYLSEELAENAKNGVRNDVSRIALLQADIAEAWREGDREYATAAFRYEAVDVTRDRATGAIVDGDADRPTETTELWTFTRRQGTEWQLSAIQSVDE